MLFPFSEKVDITVYPLSYFANTLLSTFSLGSNNFNLDIQLTPLFASIVNYIF